MKIMKKLTIACIFCLISSGASSNNQHLNPAQKFSIWTQLTPVGESFKCQLVENESQMLKILSWAGWDIDANIPNINWSSNAAIIIAPPRYHESREAKVHGLFARGNELKLEYSLMGELNTGTRTKILKDGSVMMSMGSSLPSQPITIVVSYNKNLATNRTIYCVNKKFKKKGSKMKPSH